MKQLFFIVVLLQLFLTAYSQRSNNWQFGNKAGLDFSSGVPVSTNSSQMNQGEGCSSISDQNGQLLFYSDGIKVWNALNTVMPNGTGLFGHVSSTQSSMIVPFPDDPKRYYIFTVDDVGGIRGLCYSIVNMDLDGGNGDIEQKNIQLVTPTCEKITCVNHCNGKDVWVITHLHYTDQYNAYLVTGTGINAPVISHSGRVLQWIFSGIGYLKVSPDGTKIAAAHYGQGLDLLDFNFVTGIISNRKPILDVIGNIPHSYGVEFSPNSKLLYVINSGYLNASGQDRCDISQYNNLDSSAAKIIASKIELDADSLIASNIFAALQLGQDGKIYMTTYGITKLAVVSKPNLPGIACNYSRDALPLAPGTSSTYGLPGFNQSFFKGSFDYSTSCTTNDVAFYSTKPGNAISIKWDFGDPLAGPNNISLIDSPMHTFSSPGIYEVKLIADLNCRNDTMKKTVRVEPAIADLGPDKTICSNLPYQLDPHSPGNNTYLWQDNSTASTFMASQSGLYWVEVKNTINGCVKRDSILLTLNADPIVDLGHDTVLCDGNSFLLDAGNPGASYTWQDNSNNQTLLASNAGTYFVKVNLNGCESSDSIIIQTKNIPQVSLGNDTTICNGMTILLKPVLHHADNADLLWSTGQIIPNISVTQPGNYLLHVRNECGTVTDGIMVKPGVCKLYVPTAFTPNNDGKNDVFKPGYGENVVSYSMEIYNRGGEKIFSSNNLYKGWNGKLKGILQPIGLYVWFIRYKILNDPKEYFQKGTVALVY